MVVPPHEELRDPTADLLDGIHSDDHNKDERGAGLNGVELNEVKKLRVWDAVHNESPAPEVLQARE